LLRLGAHATVIETPTSAIKLKAYGLSTDEAKRRAADAISYARQNGVTVAFFTVDGTRTDLEVLRDFYRCALDAGAEELVVVDTIGACGPEAVEFLVRSVREWMGAKVRCIFTAQRFRDGYSLRGSGCPGRRGMDSRHNKWHGRARGKRRHW